MSVHAESHDRIGSGRSREDKHEWQHRCGTPSMLGLRPSLGAHRAPVRSMTKCTSIFEVTPYRARDRDPQFHDDDDDGNERVPTTSIAQRSTDEPTQASPTSAMTTSINR